MENKPSKINLLTILLGITSLILTVALIITSVSFSRYRAQQEDFEAKAEAAWAEVETIKEQTVPLSTLKGYAEQFGVSLEFLQKFFDDKIVYRNGAEVVYADIDRSLAQSNYDWSNLVRKNGLLDYVENGKSVALKGIDVSKYQGNIDWEKVKNDGVDYAIIRLGRRGYSEGSIALDEKYKTNIENATKAGIPVGVYFFSQAINVDEALEEAEFVLENVKDYDITFPIVFDCEEIATDEARTDNLTADEMTDITIAFCEKIKEAGYTPMIYGNIKWFMVHLNLSKLEGYDKWFAQYYNSPFFPYAFQMWQYSSTGEIDGIEGGVDVNLCFKNYAAAESDGDS